MVCQDLFNLVTVHEDVALDCAEALQYGAGASENKLFILAHTAPRPLINLVREFLADGMLHVAMISGVFFCSPRLRRVHQRIVPELLQLHHPVEHGSRLVVRRAVSLKRCTQLLHEVADPVADLLGKAAVLVRKPLHGLGVAQHHLARIGHDLVHRAVHRQLAGRVVVELLPGEALDAVAALKHMVRHKCLQRLILAAVALDEVRQLVRHRLQDSRLANAHAVLPCVHVQIDRAIAVCAVHAEVFAVLSGLRFEEHNVHAGRLGHLACHVDRRRLLARQAGCVHGSERHVSELSAFQRHAAGLNFAALGRRALCVRFPACRGEAGLVGKFPLLRCQIRCRAAVLEHGVVFHARTAVRVCHLVGAGVALHVLPILVVGVHLRRGLAVFFRALGEQARALRQLGVLYGNTLHIAVFALHGQLHAAALLVISKCLHLRCLTVYLHLGVLLRLMRLRLPCVSLARPAIDRVALQLGCVTHMAARPCVRGPVCIPREQGRILVRRALRLLAGVKFPLFLARQLLPLDLLDHEAGQLLHVVFWRAERTQTVRDRLREICFLCRLVELAGVSVCLLLPGQLPEVFVAAFLCSVAEDLRVVVGRDLPAGLAVIRASHPGVERHVAAGHHAAGDRASGKVLRRLAEPVKPRPARCLVLAHAVCLIGGDRLVDLALVGHHDRVGDDVCDVRADFLAAFHKALLENILKQRLRGLLPGGRRPVEHAQLIQADVLEQCLCRSVEQADRHGLRVRSAAIVCVRNCL